MAFEADQEQSLAGMTVEIFQHDSIKLLTNMPNCPFCWKKVVLKQHGFPKGFCSLWRSEN